MHFERRIHMCCRTRVCRCDTLKKAHSCETKAVILMYTTKDIQEKRTNNIHQITSMVIDSYKSIPASFDQITGNIFQECAVYKTYISPDILDYYLPTQLPAFPANTRKNLMKRFFFFSTLAAAANRSHLDDYIDQLPNSTPFNYVFKKISGEKNSSIRYSFVILDNYFIFIRVPYLRNKSYRVLCKHITISSRARYARFAGEIWCDGYKHFLVNNNSGTYRPSDQLLGPVVQLFKYLSPNLHFQGVTFRLNTLLIP
jgi:hypothetical protein